MYGYVCLVCTYNTCTYITFCMSNVTRVQYIHIHQPHPSLPAFLPSFQK